MATDHLNLEKKCLSVCLKSNFPYRSRFHNLHVNATAIHKVNKDLMSDMFSRHQNW